MKRLITLTIGSCVLLIVLATIIFKKPIQRINKHSHLSIRALASSMEGIDTHQFTKQHQPYLDYINNK